MFFSKEADSFLNAVDRRHQERSYFAEGGDVDDHKKGKRVRRAEGDEAREDHRRGYRVGRSDGDEVKAEKHRRGKRVHARSHHSDVGEVESHAKGQRVDGNKVKGSVGGILAQLAGAGLAGVGTSLGLSHYGKKKREEHRKHDEERNRRDEEIMKKADEQIKKTDDYLKSRKKDNRSEHQSGHRVRHHKSSGGVNLLGTLGASEKFLGPKSSEKEKKARQEEAYRANELADMLRKSKPRKERHYEEDNRENKQQRT